MFITYFILILFICLFWFGLDKDKESILFHSLDLRHTSTIELLILLLYLISISTLPEKFNFYIGIIILSVFVVLYDLLGKYNGPIKFLNNIHLKMFITIIWIVINLIMITGNELNNLINISNETFSVKSIIIALIIYMFTITTTCIDNYYTNRDNHSNNKDYPKEIDVVNSIFFVKAVSSGLLLPIYLLKQFGFFVTNGESFFTIKIVLFVDSAISFVFSIMMIYIIYWVSIKFILNNRCFQILISKSSSYYNMIVTHLK